MARKAKGRNIDGIFLLDKPAGISSNHALQRVKRLFGAAKAGHTGALDPLATGLLPICLGEATKFSHYLLESDKRYIATALLGIRTDTSDADGEVVEEKPLPEGLTADQIKALLRSHFSGEIEQVPSMYSALKHQGQPLYKLARKGITVEVKPRLVTIHHAELLSFEGAEIVLDVSCSKGTYIRSIVEDIGLLLGCGAHVTALRRIETGPFDASMMYPIEQLEEIIREQYERGQDTEKKLPEGIQGPADELLLAPWHLLSDRPKAFLSDDHTLRFKQGQKLRYSESQEFEGDVLVFTEESNNFLGVAELDAGVLKAKRVINTQ